MLAEQLIHMQSTDWKQIQALYARAFPEDERSPLELLAQDETGISEILAFYEGQKFCGFACLLVAMKIAHIIYIAMEESQRGMGYGSQALERIQKRYPDHRIVVDMEDVIPDAPNYQQREQRQRFYLRNEYQLCPIQYQWRGEEYRILSQGGIVQENEFWHFWKYVACENEAFNQF